MRPLPCNYCQHDVIYVYLTVYNAIIAMVFMEQQHQHPFNGPLSGTNRVSRYQKGKANLDFLEQETVSGSGISWTIWKSAPHSRQNNYGSIPLLSFLQAGCPSCHSTNSVKLKTLKAIYEGQTVKLQSKFSKILLISITCTVITQKGPLITNHHVPVYHVIFTYLSTSILMAIFQEP